MSKYVRTIVTIPNTTAAEVVKAMASLSNFGQGFRTCNRTGDAVGYHPETVANDPDLFQATQNPDILVQKDTMNDYILQFNHRVNPGIITSIEKKIFEEYFESYL